MCATWPAHCIFHALTTHSPWWRVQIAKPHSKWMGTEWQTATYLYNVMSSVMCTFTKKRGTVLFLYNLNFRKAIRQWLRWSRGSVLAFGTQVRGFKPDRRRRIYFKGEKILSTPSFGGEVKPSVPCRRFAAYKRSLELRESRILEEICRNISRPRRVPPSFARGLSRRWTWRHLAENVGTSKGGGKQWQPTPKNLASM